eukprot:TRINITY_DN537_c0_g1_i3.p2 TRINITY_DN537_c0_g1~~TRINITY_DN537_c0_g1_i3.p2  ORF type:complete len:125 (-),score=26.56 TRINITY_DN537_c0_g1_i3:117-491(-)
MARTQVRRTVLAPLLLVAATASFLSSAFVQPRAPRSMDVGVAPAAVGALSSIAAAMPAEALDGPLKGAEICTSGPLQYIVLPLCDPIFLVTPIYNFPLVLGFFSVLITAINIALPATQPDEDLR